MGMHLFTDEQQHMTDELSLDCANKMRRIGLEPGDFGNRVLPISNSRCLGLCRCVDSETGTFAIECEPSLAGHEATDTMFHELAHTLPGCQNHSKCFLAACKIIDEEYGTNCELDRIHYYCAMFFKETYRLVIRFSGGVGDQCGVESKGDGLPLPLYEIEAIMPDGRRRVREMSTGRTFCADLVEIRALKYHEPWQLTQHPDMQKTFADVSANSNRVYFSRAAQSVKPVEMSLGTNTVVVGDSCFPGLGFETVGFERDGVAIVRHPEEGSAFPASLMVTSEYSYRKRYLAYEAVMRSGLGRLPNTWMRCSRRECKAAITSLAALVESVWNVNDHIRDGLTPSRLGSALGTFDNRLLDAALASGRSLEETLRYACQTFSDYAQHRNFEFSSDVAPLLENRI